MSMPNTTQLALLHVTQLAVDEALGTGDRLVFDIVPIVGWQRYNRDHISGEDEMVPLLTMRRPKDWDGAVVDLRTGKVYTGSVAAYASVAEYLAVEYKYLGLRENHEELPHGGESFDRTKSPASSQ